ncbi:hypothetical protein AUP68_10910 [Ilyonectria robusta]
MSVHDGERPLTGDVERNTYASATRWRHQKSSAFACHAARIHTQARGPVQTGSTQGDGSEAPDSKEIVCGPLLNYRRMHEGHWYGSVLIVVKGGGRQLLHQPFLTLRRVVQGKHPESAAQNHVNDQSIEDTRFESHCLYSDPRNTFWAFDINVPIEATETNYEYAIPDMRFSTDYKPRINNFFVPAATESMRIMFHSCNGFSVGTDEAAWSGPALWNDVMRKHKARPWHVMIGGGDQIYNDGIRVDGPLRQWTDIGNPKKRRDYPFPEMLRAKCDEYHLKNYIRWYNTEPFALANGQIPQINIWDDHDVSLDAFFRTTSTNQGPDHRRVWILCRPFYALRCLPGHRWHCSQVLHALPASYATPSVYLHEWWVFLTPLEVNRGLMGYRSCSDRRTYTGTRPESAHRHLCCASEERPPLHCWP